MTCSSGCLTKDHATYGECMRSKRQMVGFARSVVGSDKTKDKLHERELNLYRDLRAQGIQPDGTGISKLEFAKRMSEEQGMRYGTDFQVAPNGKGGYDAVSNEMVKAVTAEIDKSKDMQAIRDSAKGII